MIPFEECKVRWIREPIHTSEPLLVSYPKIVPPSGEVFNEHRCIRWIHSPETIEELISTENIFQLLYSGIIFFHNRKPSVNELIFKKLTPFLARHEIVCFSNNQLVFNDCKGKILKLQKETGRKVLLITENLNNNTINKFIERNKQDPIENLTGIWIRGHIKEMEHLVPDKFDALFLFDTSTIEFDILKRHISVSDELIKMIRSQNNNYSSEEMVIFFWNYEKSPYAPLIDVNPKLLGVTRKVKKQKNGSDGIHPDTAKIFIGGLGVNTFNGPVNAGIIGDNAYGNKQEFNQNIKVDDTEKIINLLELANELSKLRQAMKKESTQVEHDIAISNIAQAEIAATNRDQSKVMQHLKSAGQWALDVAAKICVPVVTEILKQEIAK